MSRRPAQEPILGDKRTCDALDLIIVPRVRDLGGGFSVHRALPHAKRQIVGPFIFQEVTFFTKIGGQICGIGYHK